MIRGVFMLGEFEINEAREWPRLPDSPRFTALPGRVAVLMCERPSCFGSILLTDRSAGNLRPDAGVVASVGAGVTLSVGDRVYVRPYVGLHVEMPEGVYRLLGREVFQGEETASAIPWWEHVLASDLSDSSNSGESSAWQKG